MQTCSSKPILKENQKKIQNVFLSLCNVTVTCTGILKKISVDLYVKNPFFPADGSDTDYQMSGLTPVIPDELFR